MLYHPTRIVIYIKEGDEKCFIISQSREWFIPKLSHDTFLAQQHWKRKSFEHKINKCRANFRMVLFMNWVTLDISQASSRLNLSFLAFKFLQTILLAIRGNWISISNNSTLQSFLSLHLKQTEMLQINES